MHVLLLEDEKKIADFIVAGFEASGFQIHHEADGFRGLNTALIRSFDAIVMDVNLPLMDGFQVLTEIRRKGLYTPVVLLTARTDLADRLKAFELGTDDYLPKPFFIEELIIRVQTVVARKAGNVEKTVQQSGVTLDRFTRMVQWGARSSSLTQREFVLLEYLMLSPGQILSRQQILKHVWNVDFDPGTNVVDVCIQRIRKKFAHTDADHPDVFPLETIRGVGYRLNNA